MELEIWQAIVLAAVVGGVAFMLLDLWQRKHATQAATVTAPAAEPQTTTPIWTPYGQPAPEPPRPVWTPPTAERPAWTPLSEERTEPLPPRPLWTPPSSDAPRARWDDDDRYRGHDDEDDPPPGLWSGWARR
ncbi:hypothetical protein OJ997_25140 [Solirubrobacter phytolaccae]|uniref:Uncharacterized protein n=1 Tax=Solirubrobacter phytolaccae TaxID=1404360 RepID=A0A9X3S9P6_9ACTN|nr:hypothetical protein [Solirubrobacter phytolaccae]MDA0183619.1 hypothetical protein [Solirubrobacter phytolaccae]